MFQLSHTLHLLGVVTVISSFVWLYFYNSFQYWKRRNVPYLTPVFGLGDTLDVVTGKASIAELASNAYLTFKKQGYKHGGIYISHTPVYIPVEPNIIKSIIIGDADSFPNHGLYLSYKVDPLSAHLLNMEGDKWRTLRSKLSASFTSAKMKKMFSIMVEMVDPYLKLLDSCADEAGPIEIKSIVTRFTTDIVCACILGVETKTMQFKNGELLRHGRSFFDYQLNRYKIAMAVIIPRRILETFNFKIFKKGTEKYAMDVFKKIFEHRKTHGSARDDLTDCLMRLVENREGEKNFFGKDLMEPLEMSDFVAQLFLFFGAGYETSSSTQTFALYELAKYPDCQKRLRDEVSKVLQEHGNEFSYEAVMEMKYLDNVVDETLRKYPVLPILPRKSTKNYTVPGTDLTIEKGTYVAIGLLGLHYDPDYYPDPEKFDPDRFSSKNKGNRPHMAHLPFGEGPRLCIGKRFGLLQTKLGLACLIRNYEVTLNEKTTKDFKFDADKLILRKEGDIWINLKKIC